MVRDALETRPVSVVAGGPGVPARRPPLPPRQLFREAVALALPAWLVSRALALVSLLIAEAVHGGVLRATGDIVDARGWWVWDAGWYRVLSLHGYAGAPSVRFFPLYPMLGRGLGTVFGGRDDIALLVISNLCALAYGAAIVLLVRREIDLRVARRSVWLTLLAPGAAVLALAYSEPLSGLLTAAFFIAVRSRSRWIWWALPIGALEGLSRPTGLVLAVVPLVELVVHRHEWRAAARRTWALVAATVTPIAGAAAYCSWCWVVYGDPLMPYTTQTDPRLRGTIIGNPLHGLLHPPAHGGLPAVANVGIAVLAIALLVLVWRRMPASIASWATLSAAAALTSAHATSLPRYLSADFPLLIALASVVRPRWAAVGMTALSAAGFVAVAVVGFGGGVVL